MNDLRRRKGPLWFISFTWKEVLNLFTTILKEIGKSFVMKPIYEPLIKVGLGLVAIGGSVTVVNEVVIPKFATPVPPQPSIAFPEVKEPSPHLLDAAHRSHLKQQMIQQQAVNDQIRIHQDQTRRAEEMARRHQTMDLYRVQQNQRHVEAARRHLRQPNLSQPQYQAPTVDHQHFNTQRFNQQHFIKPTFNQQQFSAPTFNQQRFNPPAFNGSSFNHTPMPRR